MGASFFESELDEDFDCDLDSQLERMTVPTVSEDERKRWLSQYQMNNQSAYDISAATKGMATS